MLRFGFFLSFFALATMQACSISSAASLNGFDLDDALIEPSAIMRGGPPRDGIPSIQNPQFDTAEQADWLDGDARILGISLNGISRAYPVAILNWHEVVNDAVGGQHVAVTYCPLCGTGMVFESSFDSRTLSFGVSGLLYQSDVLLYDRETESLWSQILGQAVTGPYRGQRMQSLPLQHTSWQAWLKQHPDTEVLNTNTGYRRDYNSDPYAGYADSPATMFPVINKAPATWHPKEWVLGISVENQHKAYPFAELRAHGAESFQDEFAGVTFDIVWDDDNQSAAAYRDGELQPALTSFWFAWYAFHPDTEIFTNN